MRKVKLLLGILFSTVLCLVVFVKVVADKPESQSGDDFQEASTFSVEDFNRFNKVISDIKNYYYKKMDSSVLLTQALKGLLSNLDPHSAYLGPKDLKDLQRGIDGEFGGIGVEVVPNQGVIKIVTPLDGTPADRAGIKAGDYVIQINKKLVRDITLEEAMEMMRGKPGTKVDLTVIREGTHKPLVFNIVRETIKIQTVKSKLLEPGYGYIRLALFQEPTAADFDRAVEKLKKDSGGKLKGVVIDVRNNPGGLLESAIQITDSVLDAKILKKENKLIVYTKGQIDERRIVAEATAGDILSKIPIVVLINGGSASASEILAGALQDHRRAIIAGTRSFGKGSVQTLIPIDKDTAIKLTTDLYYTPSGKSIQAEGIRPDINIEELHIVVNKDEHDVLHIEESSFVDHINNGNGSNHNKNHNEAKKLIKEEQDLARKDYQLYEALHILKSQNIAKFSRLY